MNEIDEIFNRINYREIIFYLLYNGEIKPESVSLPLGERIDQSFETFIQRLSELCPQLNSDNDELFVIISDFAGVQREVFMEVGFIAGFELYGQISAGKKEV